MAGQPEAKQDGEPALSARQLASQSATPLLMGLADKRDGYCDFHGPITIDNMSEGLMTPEARLRIEGSRTASGQGTAVVQTRNLESQIEKAISRSRDWMLAAPAQDGYWWGGREADTTLESDYILYLHILGQLESEKTPKLAKYIRTRQLEDGGWNIFYGGPAELNATVKAYVALRLAGDAADAPQLQQAKKRIHEVGGLETTNS